MSCKTGDFEGIWKVVVGSREGATLEVVKNGQGYELREGQNVLFNLEVDTIALTLESPLPSTSITACLSLWQDCQYLFGMELGRGSFQLWGAERSSGGSAMDVPRNPSRPSWRESELWTVQATSLDQIADPPVEVGDLLRIERQAGSFEIFKEPETEPFDTLQESDSNRTLDGQIRSIAQWRNGPGGQSYLFSMLVVPDSVMERIRDQGAASDPDAVRRILSSSGLGLIPFEIDLLARHIVDGSEVGVWGADEG